MHWLVSLHFFIMRQLGEMVEEPVFQGSFSYFAYKYWGSFCWFLPLAGITGTLHPVSMSELTALGYMYTSGGRQSHYGRQVFFSFSDHQRPEPDPVKVYGMESGSTGSSCASLQ